MNVAETIFDHQEIVVILYLRRVCESSYIKSIVFHCYFRFDKISSTEAKTNGKSSNSSNSSSGKWSGSWQKKRTITISRFWCQDLVVWYECKVCCAHCWCILFAEKGVTRWIVFDWDKYINRYRYSYSFVSVTVIVMQTLCVRVYVWEAKHSNWNDNRNKLFFFRLAKA